MKKYPCTIRMNRSALKEYYNMVLGQPDTLIAMSKFILLLALTKIWDIPYRREYNLHGLVGNRKGIYDVHLPIQEDVVILFRMQTPLKAKIKAIGSHSDIFD